MTSPRKHSRETTENIGKLKEKLRELFQLDRGDLDFGLYRIMAHKSAEVEAFLAKDLLPQVTGELGEIAEPGTSTLQEELKRSFAEAKRHRPDPENSYDVKKLQAQLQATKLNQQAEAGVYNHLCNFFSRYYNEGDFMSQRRYKGHGKEAYAIPYNGEEIKLHWANADQYYIKTTENYASYVFIIVDNNKERRVRFEIAAADNEKDNIKETNGKERFFILAKDFIAVDKEVLSVRFEHRPLQDAEKKRYPQNGIKRQASINAESERKIFAGIEKHHAIWQLPLRKPCPTEADENRSVLGKHLTAYTAKNSFDYFIHKDLGGFLHRELDYYLKNDVMSIDDLKLSDDPIVFIRSLAQIKAIQRVGGKIIDFLAQLENFQKRLWLKKKFVLETQYCVTLDKVPEALYAQIAANQAQHDEWLRLFAIDELNGDLASPHAYSQPLKPEFLKAHPHLVLDTRHFDGEFVDTLLAALSAVGALEEQMNGVLVHGENFQALNLMHARYKGQVKCVYIDPPYNTDASAILYKNGYKNSSWLSLTESRLQLAHPLLRVDGIICVAIDDEEMPFLCAVMGDNFAMELGIVAVCSNPAGRKTKGRFAPSHEYALFYGKTELAAPGSLEKTKKQIESYPHEDAAGHFIWTSFIRSGTSDRRQDRPKMFYPIFVDDKDQMRIPKMEWNEGSRQWALQESPSDNEIAMYPVKKNADEGRWHRGHKRILENPSEYRVRRIKDHKISLQFKVRMDEKALPKTWWDRGHYQSASGTIALTNILGSKNFDFPKSVDLVKDCLICSINGHENAYILDYFAGSGTTGHAVIELNRQDNGNRKYVLVEMGEHFENVLLPRMKKVVYSKDWKDGKPINRQGVSQLFKYIRVESYEDTMDSLVVRARQDLVATMESKRLIEDYQLRYALGAETEANVSLLGADFIDPFDYRLAVVRDGVRRDEKVDLAETFNFLLGLRLQSRRRIGDVLAITGKNPQGENCLVLWRQLTSTDNPKLDAWFAKHRKKFGDDLKHIYVNGDHTLNALIKPGEHWRASSTEPVFKDLMFATD